VAGGFAAAKIVVIECGKVIVDERISVDEFDGARGMKSGGDVGSKDASCFQAQYGAQALAAGKDAVAHGLMDGRRRRGLRRHQAIERRIHK